MTERVMILGGGMTGLAAGMASGFPVFEAAEEPGGICSSYYVRPGDRHQLHAAPQDGEAYRFEIGGGHWIFGGDPVILALIHALAPLESYTRRSSVYLPTRDTLVPYPIQNHLRVLGREVAAKALVEMIEAATARTAVTTMADWLRASFGETLCQLFFDPFHRLYTAGLWKEIAPQDAYKSPVDLRLVTRGAFEDVQAVGYNVTFTYPRQGLDTLAREMAARCDIRFGKRVTGIDLTARQVHFGDGESAAYDRLLSTLPLNRMLELTRLDIGLPADPAPPVLVFNIGAVRGPRCPDDHWVYIPVSEAGFHRVGFYSNVDPSFLPASDRETRSKVSIYVEQAYPEGKRPPADAVARLGERVSDELRSWGWITETEVVDPTWIDVAYTWSRPGSTWRGQALEALRGNDVFQVGRYARWVFQGIADSIRDGLFAGSAMAHAARGASARAGR